MTSNTLYDAIALVRAGKNEEARQIIFDIIRNDSQNEMAWMWLAETLSSDVDRMKVLKACLQINPESKIAKMAITKLQEKFNEKEINLPADAPFWEGATYDPSVPERTGHTGAIIGFDGSFILTEVSDFDEVVDLRESGSLPAVEAVEAEAKIPAAPFVSENMESSVETDDIEEAPAKTSDFSFDTPTVPFRRSQPEIEELSFEPDLSNYLYEEGEAGGLDKAAPPANRVPLFRQQNAAAPGDQPADELSIEELGFFEEEAGDQPTVNLPPPPKPRIYGELMEEDLVEGQVIKSTVAENARRRIKRERTGLVILVLGLFIIIGLLCAVLAYAMGFFTPGSPNAGVLPTQMVLPSNTPEPTATATLPPTATSVPEPTATATLIPTATPLVSLGGNAITASSAAAIVQRLNQPLDNGFFSNLQGDRAAILDGRNIQVWDLAAGEQIHSLSGHNDLVTDVVFSADGRFLVSGARDFSIILWDLGSGAILKNFGMDAATITRIYGDRTKNYPNSVSVDYSPDGTTIAAGAFGVVNILDITTGFTRGTFALSDEALQIAVQDSANRRGFEVKFNENGWVLSAAMSKNLVGLDTLDAAPLYQFELGAKGVVTYAEDRIHMVEADTGGVTVRTLLDGNIINGFGGREVKPNQAPPDFVLTDDAARLGIEIDAAENQFAVEVWDVPGDASQMTFQGICADNTCSIPVYAFFPDDDRIIVSRQSGDGSIEVLVVNLISNQILFRISGLPGGVTALAASPNGELAAGLDSAGNLRVWNADSGEELLSLAAAGAENLQFSRDGEFILAWGADRFYAWGNP